MEIQIKTESKGNLNKIPQHILENKLLDLVIKELPSNYNFEIHKCIWRIEEEKLRLKRNISVLLQLPQGLMIFASRLADIFENFS